MKIPMACKAIYRLTLYPLSSPLTLLIPVNSRRAPTKSLCDEFPVPEMLFSWFAGTRRERLKKEATHPRLVDGMFNKQGN